GPSRACPRAGTPARGRADIHGAGRRATKAHRSALQGTAEGPVVLQGSHQALCVPVPFHPLERSTKVAKSTLIAHCGARIVSRQELDTIDAPAPTKTWFPVRHS